jgi:stage II sporulation protein R
MKRLHIALTIGVVFSVLLTAYSDFNSQCQEVRDNTVRLHVLANSDSDEDQSAKYGVRDALLLAGEDIFGPAASKAEAEEEIAAHLGKIEEIAAAELARRNIAQPVKAELVNMFFTTRQYGEITVPAGRYDAVRVTIGEGEGRNWWCVMFPPMCVPAAMEQSNLPVEEQVKKLGTTPVFRPKFAVVELVETIKNKLSGEPEEVLAETDPIAQTEENEQEIVTP